MEWNQNIYPFAGNVSKYINPITKYGCKSRDEFREDAFNLSLKIFDDLDLDIKNK